MTLSEFKAWFEGFTESIEGKSAPTQKQWAKIKEKVALIDGAPTTHVVYLDRWVQPYLHYWDRYWTTAGMATGPAAYLDAVARNDGIGVANFASMGAAGGRYDVGADQTVEFDPHAAMRELGRMEAAA